MNVSEVEVHNMAQEANRLVRSLGTSISRLKRLRGEVTGAEAERFDEVSKKLGKSYEAMRALVEATKPAPSDEELDAMRTEADEMCREAM